MEPKPTVFEFTSYKFWPQEKKVVFNYKQEFEGQEAIYFTEMLVLPKMPDLLGIPDGLINKILQGVHLILGISYYKFYCATKIYAPYVLTKEEARFWDIVYQKGLGEFYYRNGLDPKNSPKFEFSKDAKIKNFLAFTLRCLTKKKILLEN